MIPPNTPICKEVIPTTDVVAPLNIVSVPPFNEIIAPMEACMTKNAIAAARAATAFSFFAIPIATPIAKMRGRFPNIIFPASFIIRKSAFGTVPGPITFNKP